MIRPLHRAVPAAALLGLLTACGAGATPVPRTVHSAEPTPAVAPTPAPAPTPTVDDTAVVVDLTWAQTSESDRDSMCAGIAVFGTHWAAEQMREGAGSDSVNWERAAVLVQHKCEQR